MMDRTWVQKIKNETMCIDPVGSTTFLLHWGLGTEALQWRDWFSPRSCFFDFAQF